MIHKSYWGFILLILSLAFTSACGVFGIRNAEEAKYSVIAKDRAIEIRRYEPHIVAKTQVRGSYRDTQGKAFRILAGYIFGKNVSREKISMTAPVLQNPETPGKKIAMTAPVVQKRGDNDSWIMTFTMPAKYRMQDLPKPLDDRVTLEELPEKYVATIRYTGLLTEENNADHIAQLQEWLEQHKEYKAIAAPKIAGYDPPWTLPFLRRNEIWIEMAPVP